MKKLLLAVLASLSFMVATQATTEASPAAPDAPAHIDWSAPYDICQLINVAFFENPSGQNYNVFAARNFNFFGHYGVSCTIYPYDYGYPPTYQWVCYVYDRHTHEVFWIGCPAP